MEHFGSYQPFKYLAISTNSSGNTTLLSANANRSYRIIGFQMGSAGTVTATLTDGASGTVLVAAYFVAGSNMNLPVNAENPWNQGTKNTALVLNLSGSVAVQGVLVYQEV